MDMQADFIRLQMAREDEENHHVWKNVTNQNFVGVVYYSTWKRRGHNKHDSEYWSWYDKIFG